MEHIPIAKIITPNIYEAEILSETSIKSESDLLNAIYVISRKFNGAILVKGGYLSSSAEDLLDQNGEFQWFRSDRIGNNNTHGTGCTLSSSLACNLANELSIKESIINSKFYIRQCLNMKLDLGNGTGPINHLIF